MGKSKPKGKSGGGKKGGGNKKAHLSSEAKNIFAQAGVTVGIVSKNDSLFPTASLGDTEAILSHLEWQVEKDVLLVPENVENKSLKSFATTLSNNDSSEMKYYALLQSKLKPLLFLKSSPVNLEEAQTILEAIANARLDATAAAAIDEHEKQMRAGKKNTEKSTKGSGLTSEQRYAYWAEFSTREAVNERAMALIDSKGLKWQILQGKDRPMEFPTRDVDGSVNAFLKKYGESDLLILRRRGPYDQIFLTFDVQQRVGIAAWQSAMAQECIKQLQDQIIESTHPSRFSKFCIMIKDSRPVFVASLTIDVTDLFNALLLANGSNGESECAKCKSLHLPNDGVSDTNLQADALRS